MPPTPEGPLLVFGPRSTTYDFGPHHPLTPLRFGPGIDLLRHVGAEPGLAPEPAADDELEWVHTRRYVDAVRMYGEEPWLPGDYGFGHSDNPAFPGMHEAAASVAGGSIAAMEAILRGDVLHAHHPGGGLHHAMPERAWGFCIYDDPALAIARARRSGLRVLYLDVDVHHGDGVQTIFYDDPGVLTISVHESGRYLFPGTGFPDELGVGAATGSSVNLPFEPYAGEGSWLGSILEVVPGLAAAFGPDIVVSQHGADAHAWDPLAHLRVTTTAQWEVAKLADSIAHRYAGGRWLATGGGGYAAYRVVPRTWALTWLAGAHREPPRETPSAWRARWASDAAAFGDGPPPTAFLDDHNAGIELSDAQGQAERASAERAIAVRAVVVPRLLREARERGWWTPDLAWPADAERLAPVVAPAPGGSPAVIASIEGPALARLRLASRVMSPADPEEAHALLLAALGGSRHIGLRRRRRRARGRCGRLRPYERRPPASLVVGVGRRPGSAARGACRTAPRCARGARAGGDLGSDRDRRRARLGGPAGRDAPDVDREAAPGARRLRAPAGPAAGRPHRPVGPAAGTPGRLTAARRHGPSVMRGPSGRPRPRGLAVYAAAPAAD